MKRLLEKKSEDCSCGCGTKEECTCAPDCDCGCKKKEEGVNFDKFMDSILISENRRSPIKCEPDSPQRIRAKRNQERPLGRIRFGR
jgi:hypothetical protein